MHLHSPSFRHSLVSVGPYKRRVERKKNAIIVEGRAAKSPAHCEWVTSMRFRAFLNTLKLIVGKVLFIEKFTYLQRGSGWFSPFPFRALTPIFPSFFAALHCSVQSIDQECRTVVVKTAKGWALKAKGLINDGQEKE